MEQLGWDFVVKVGDTRAHGRSGWGLLINRQNVLAASEFGDERLGGHTSVTFSSGKKHLVDFVSGFGNGLVVLHIWPGAPAEISLPTFSHPVLEAAFTTIAETPEGPVVRSGTLREPSLGRLDGEPPGAVSVRGAPVLSEGSVVGIALEVRGNWLHLAPMTELVGWLDEWAPEMRDALYPSVRRTEFSAGAWDTLRLFDSIARLDPPLSPPIELWMAIVASARARRGNFAAAAARHLGATFTRKLPPPDTSSSPDALVLPALHDVITEARRVHALTSPEGRMHRRHLITALLRVWPTSLQELGVDAEAMRAELVEIARIRRPQEEHAAWETLLAASAQAPAMSQADSPSTPSRRSRAGYSNDSADAVSDELDVQADVEALCDVVAAKDAQPPLAVGLFGQWGAGKSTFMNLMRQRTKKLADAAVAAEKAEKETAYCSDIVQIEFNAWHYMDANLWASLAVRIFEGLSTDDGAERADTEAGMLLEQLQQREKALAPIEEKIGRAIQDKRLDEAVREVGLETTRSELVELMAELQRFRALTRPVHVALLRLRNRRARERLVASVVVVGVVAALTTWAVSLFDIPAVLRAVPAFTVVLVAVTTVLKRARAGLKKVNDVLGAVGLTAADVDKRVTADRQIVAIKQRLAELDRRRGLYQFVLDRAGSEDYRKHFGLISVVRNDFEQLAKRLADHAPNRRIVLYVDDLDRCPPERVVDVLQAVHLLLAFKLFVVVVGVDPRWLIRSLQRQYESILSSGKDDEAFAESTPQNYLEKIFQIPFALRAMDDTGFGRLIGTMLNPAPDPSAPPTLDDTEHAPSPPKGAAADTATAAERPRRRRPRATPATTLPPPIAAAPPAQPQSSQQQKQEYEQPAIDANPTALRVTEDEVACMQRIGRMVRTPREAKRIVNLYRLVRASLPAGGLDSYLQDRDYERVITLLGVLVGFRAQAHDVFNAARAAPDGPWASFVQELVGRHEGDEWERLAEQLRRLDSWRGTLQQFRPWVVIVERYSFDTALAAVSTTTDDIQDVPST